MKYQHYLVNDIKSVQYLVEYVNTDTWSAFVDRVIQNNIPKHENCHISEKREYFGTKVYSFI